MQLFYNGCKITIVPVLKQFILIDVVDLFLNQLLGRGRN
jgi:hypothetical protein